MLLESARLCKAGDYDGSARCRDAVIDAETGFLCGLRDVE